MLKKWGLPSDDEAIVVRIEADFFSLTEYLHEETNLEDYFDKLGSGALASFNEV